MAGNLIKTYINKYFEGGRIYSSPFLYFEIMLESQREFAELILPYRVGNLSTSYGMARFGVDNMD